MKGKAELKKAFKSAKTSEQMLKALKKMEPRFDESELGMEYWAITRELLSDGVLYKDKLGIPEKVLSFGNRALKSLLDTNKQDYYTNLPCIKNRFSNISIVDIMKDNVNHHGSSLFVASTCCLLGAACFDLKRYNESLSYLNWAYRNISKLEADEGDNRCASNCVLHVLDLTHQELFRVKQDMFGIREGLHHLTKIVEIRESVLKEDSFQLGKAYKDACSGHMAIMDYNQARPFCFKALEIYTKHMGPDTVEVAGLRSELGTMYYDAGEHEKAIEQNQLAQCILKKHTPNSPDLLALEIENAHMMYSLDMHEEVIEVLKVVVARDDIENKFRAMAFLTMAKAFCGLGNFADAKKYIRIARKIIEKKDFKTFSVAAFFGDISDIYRNMNDFESAMFFSKRALSFPELHERILSECSSRIFSLVSLSGKEKKEIIYMQGLVEKLKEKFGPAHFEVGYGYISLGAAYLKSGQQKSAVKFMAMAKHIIDATVDHISLFCSDKERYYQIIRILEKVVKYCEGKQEYLDDAVKILNTLKERVAESPTVASTQSTEDLCSTISKCGTSGDLEK